MRLLSAIGVAAVVGAAQVTAEAQVNERPVKGRFLHITDVHADPWFVAGSAQRTSCHRGHPFGNDRPAGPWGHPVSVCDSPISLVNATFDWLRDTVAPHVDFVLWTGDNARHDTDATLNRPLSEVAALNRLVSAKMSEVFNSTPVVPSIGNNDVGVHNTLKKGPNAVLDALHEAWHAFLPPSQHDLFVREGYYANEVIADSLAVTSLNTMWIFASNDASKGCSGKHSVGTRHLDWLVDQLRGFRSRRVQTYIIGHVPPASWYEKCSKRYGKIVLNYQDTILGSFFGHANVDYFSFIAQNLEKRADFSVAGLSPDDLRDQFADIHATADLDERGLAVITGNPSVIPTYFPSVRVYTYNTTASTRYQPAAVSPAAEIALDVELAANDDDGEDTEVELSIDAQLPFDALKKKHKKKRRRSSPPLHTSPDSPIRTNRYLTPLSYTEYYVDLPAANELGKDVPPKWQIEYTTEDAYGLTDLTIKSWVRLARELATDDAAWRRFVARFVVSSGAM